MKLKDILSFELFKTGNLSFHIYNVLIIVLIFGIARTIIWLLKKYLNKRVKSEQMDQGKSTAVYQILVYLIYTISIVIAIESTGARITVLLAGSTALLVGLGLGLQDFFKDLVAGFIVLFERTVAVGDIIEVNGMVCMVKEIGLRTTTVYTREDIVVIIPNTKITNFQVVNWTRNKKPTRFDVECIVDFQSNIEKTEALLLESLKGIKEVVNKPNPNVVVREFTDRGVRLQLFFWSHNQFRIEITLGKIRKNIERNFRLNGIYFALPQRSIDIKNLPEQQK